MTFPVFEDLPTFIQAWETALAQLEARDRRIVSEYATRRRTMAQLAMVHGVSKERVRQIINLRFSVIRGTERDRGAPIRRALDALQC